MSVTAIIVTRGDVELTEILESIPTEYERIVWDNGYHGYPHVDIYKNGDDWRPDGPPGISDFSVYGRYAAIKYASNDLIYVQDDDVLHTTEGIEEIVWQSENGSAEYGRLVCNMPANFRHAFYQEHALVGFGACFHRDAPERAFRRWDNSGKAIGVVGLEEEMGFFRRTCDIVFTGLTPYSMVDVLYEDMPWATADNRMWKQPTHRDERGRMLELVKQVRDAA